MIDDRTQRPIASAAHKAEQSAQTQAQGLTERAVLDILCRWSREDGYTYADATRDLRVLAARPQAAAETQAQIDTGYPIIDVRAGQEVEVGWRWRGGRIVYYRSKEDVDTAERLNLVAARPQAAAFERPSWERGKHRGVTDFRRDLDLLRAARPQAAEPGDERARFEAHIRREFPTADDELLLGRSKSGSYGSMVTEHAWRAWCAALAPAAAGGETP